MQPSILRVKLSISGFFKTAKLHRKPLYAKEKTILLQMFPAKPIHRSLFLHINNVYRYTYIYIVLHSYMLYSHHNPLETLGFGSPKPLNNGPVISLRPHPPRPFKQVMSARPFQQVQPGSTDMITCQAKTCSKDQSGK